MGHKQRFERRGSGLKARAGASLIELIAALLLIGLVAALIVALLRTETRIAGHSADRVEALETLRTAGAVLAADFLPLDQATDLVGVSADTAALRVFRGTGIVCGFAGTDPLVRYRGLRQPEPTKDSVLLVTAAPAVADSLRFVAAAPGACIAVPGEEVLRIQLSLALAARDVILFYESGSYHLAGALRYRRGGGGRQPMTAELLAAATRFVPEGVGPDAIGIELVPATSSRSIRGLPLAPPTRVRVPLRNRP